MHAYATLRGLHFQNYYERLEIDLHPLLSQLKEIFSRAFTIASHGPLRILQLNSGYAI
jgi:hypothetical protein